MCLDCRLNPNKVLALREARASARSGNLYWTLYWINRAQQFASLTDRQWQNLQRALKQGGLTYNLRAS